MKSDWRFVAGALALLGAVACSDSADDGEVGAPAGGGADAGHDASAARPPTEDSGTRSDAAAGARDGAAALPDASSETDSGVRDSGVDADRESDASYDAATDAGTAPVVDASPTPDAAADPLACSGGSGRRCSGFAEEQCVNGQWARTFTNNCCHEPGRFTVVTRTGAGNPRVLRDSRTGLEWSAQSAGILGDCTSQMSGAGDGWRLPTVDELLGIVIGPLDANRRPVCTPTVDQAVFWDVEPKPMLAATEPGFVHMGTGQPSDGSTHPSPDTWERLCVR